MNLNSSCLLFNKFPTLCKMFIKNYKNFKKSSNYKPIIFGMRLQRFFDLKIFFYFLSMCHFVLSVSFLLLIVYI